LKQAVDLGYKVTEILEGHRFDSKYLFNEYIEEFYKLKSQVKGGERYVVKLLLNGLYGYFGRKSEGLFVDYTPLGGGASLEEGLTPTRELHSRVPLTDNYDLTILSGYKHTPANVAIAAAITAYSRILINQFKVDPNNVCFYSDTDSVFLQKPLDPKWIGPELGKFKDELNGEFITEAIFMKWKTYAYKTSDGKSKVVMAGIPRNTFTFDQFCDTFKTGQTYSYTKESLSLN
jgi:hypothetical protein